jgi:hypothetical protein
MAPPPALPCGFCWDPLPGVGEQATVFDATTAPIINAIWILETRICYLPHRVRLVTKEDGGSVVKEPLGSATKPGSPRLDAVQ